MDQAVRNPYEPINVRSETIQRGSNQFTEWSFPEFVELSIEFCPFRLRTYSIPGELYFHTLSELLNEFY
jgi:hypothetical protein